MARPREFDRDAALQKATEVFWAKGYAATSTDDLLDAMQIGRQSLYNTFGDKHSLYVAALDAYQRKTLTGHFQRLNAPASPLAGLSALLTGLVVDDDDVRALGCMGVGSTCEFSTSDPELVELRNASHLRLQNTLRARIREGQATGEIDPALSADGTADFIQLTMTGIQLAARGGAGADQLKSMARFAVDRLRAH